MKDAMKPEEERHAALVKNLYRLEPFVYHGTGPECGAQKSKVKITE
jgi:hypothetical protein